MNGWKAPGPVGVGSARQDRARRLLEGGMLSPHPGASVATRELTFVVPVRDRPEQLERCLRALGEPRHVRVITSRGPAAARNTGLSACSTTFVGFVDSDVVLPETAARRLLAHFADPWVAAVAPRVCALGGRGPVAGYEAHHSALDMGPDGGLVAPGWPIPYVPSAALLCGEPPSVPDSTSSCRSGRTSI